MLSIFDLPLELREMIYEYVAVPSHMFLTFLDNGELSAKLTWGEYDSWYTEAEEEELLAKLDRTDDILIMLERSDIGEVIQAVDYCPTVLEPFPLLTNFIVDAQQVAQAARPTSRKLKKTWSRLRHSIAKLQECLKPFQQRRAALRDSLRFLSANKLLTQELHTVFRRSVPLTIDMHTEQLQQLLTHGAHQLRLLANTRICKIRFATAVINTNTEVSAHRLEPFITFVKFFPALFSLTVQIELKRPMYPTEHTISTLFDPFWTESFLANAQQLSRFELGIDGIMLQKKISYMCVRSGMLRTDKRLEKGLYTIIVVKDEDEDSKQSRWMRDGIEATPLRRNLTMSF